MSGCYLGQSSRRNLQVEPSFFLNDKLYIKMSLNRGFILKNFDVRISPKSEFCKENKILNAPKTTKYFHMNILIRKYFSASLTSASEQLYFHLKKSFALLKTNGRFGQNKPYFEFGLGINLSCKHEHSVCVC